MTGEDHGLSFAHTYFGKQRCSCASLGKITVGWAWEGKYVSSPAHLKACTFNAGFMKNSVSTYDIFSGLGCTGISSGTCQGKRLSMCRIYSVMAKLLNREGNLDQLDVKRTRIIRIFPKNSEFVDVVLLT